MLASLKVPCWYGLNISSEEVRGHLPARALVKRSDQIASQSQLDDLGGGGGSLLVLLLRRTEGSRDRLLELLVLDRLVGLDLVAECQFGQGLINLRRVPDGGGGEEKRTSGEEGDCDS